jgi:hypothetical protein
MKRSISTILMILVMVMVLPGSLQVSAAPLQAGGTPFVRQISSSISTSFPPNGNQGHDPSGQQTAEIPPFMRNDSGAGKAPTTQTHPQVNRSLSLQTNHGSSDPLKAPRVRSNAVTRSNSKLSTSFTGINHRDQRLANGGNQFSLEPPDQGLCAGNGFVLETVNTVMRVFDTHGHPKTDVIDLNTFYGYPAQVDRTAGVLGPFITDPSCYFDKDTQRWFHVVLTLEQDPNTGDLLGPNHLDLAVSASADPTASWVVYRLPVQDDGTDGTPNHGCSLGPCIGDYPHIGADKYGFYITTNEYSLFGPEFHAAQVYAFSKAALAANTPTVAVAQFDTVGMVKSSQGVQPGFTIWPAEAAAGHNNTQAHGTEFFMSSNAGEEANGIPGGGFSNEVVLWAMTNTQSLGSSSPSPLLSDRVLKSEVYGVPPQSDQRTGNFPQGQCINDTTMVTPFGTGCWNFLFLTEPPHTEVESHLDSNDSRMQQVWYADGKLWTALDTVVNVGGKDKAGIAYFVVSPRVGANGGLGGTIAKQGYLAVAGNNVTYPAIAVLSNGKGVMAFTLVGRGYFPSAAYALLDTHGTGAVHIAARGKGPDDGFTGYKAQVGDPPRPRWGDYGAALTDGNSIWIASEYIAQTCTLAQYAADPFGSCGGTRTALANWATRVSKVTP